jgi:uncharacterized protein
MRVIRPDAFVTMPWKNGGGITHEIAREMEGERILWRLSMAEVASDGPFSSFPGLTRILTVIRGAGLVLRTPEGVITAEPMHPVRFSGDLPVECTRIAGDVTDLNVIFDGARIDARVTRLAGPEEWSEGSAAFLTQSGSVAADDVAVPTGSVALDFVTLSLATGATGLLVMLTRI